LQAFVSRDLPFAASWCFTARWSPGRVPCRDRPPLYREGTKPRSRAPGAAGYHWAIVSGQNASSITCSNGQACRGEGRFGKAGFALRRQQGVTIGFGQDGGELVPQTRVLSQHPAGAAALLANGQPPTVAAQIGLELPRQQVCEQHGETVGQPVPLTPPHALDLFGDVQDAGTGHVA